MRIGSNALGWLFLTGLWAYVCLDSLLGGFGVAMRNRHVSIWYPQMNAGIAMASFGPLVGVITAYAMRGASRWKKYGIGVGVGLALILGGFALAAGSGR